MGFKSGRPLSSAKDTHVIYSREVVWQAPVWNPGEVMESRKQSDQRSCSQKKVGKQSTGKKELGGVGVGFEGG